MIACINPIVARSSGLSRDANDSVVKLLNLFASNYFKCHALNVNTAFREFPGHYNFLQT